MLLPRHALLQWVLVATGLAGGCLPAQAEEKPVYQGASANNAPASNQPAAEPRRSIRSDVPLETLAWQAAERAIPYIEESGTTWVKERKCLACHYSGYMLWSLRDAGQRGFDVDKAILAESTAWALNQPMTGHGVEGAAQILIARDRSDRTEKTATLIAALRDSIIKDQQTDGSWKPGGQLPSQKRPVSETAQVSTMLCVLALDSLDAPNEQRIAARDQGLAWLAKTPPNGETPAVSSEWYALRLLIAKKLGNPAEAETLRDQIVSAQHSDGGWGWLCAEPSDAFGTGVSIYALSKAGVPPSDPSIRKAWKFLIETQTDVGSWVVNGTKTANRSKPHPFSSFWGSTWAVLGLSQSLPARNRDETPR
jgi:squalene-hopene/tetraprenyl-beta-curcumene cyclase